MACSRRGLTPGVRLFWLQGRGTVVTGRVEQGIVRTGDEVEILGIQAATKTTVTGTAHPASSADRWPRHRSVSQSATAMAVLRAHNMTQAELAAALPCPCMRGMRESLPVMTGRAALMRAPHACAITNVRAVRVRTGVEMFKKQLNEGQAGDNVGLLLRGIKRDDVVRGQVQSRSPLSWPPGLDVGLWCHHWRACCMGTSSVSASSCTGPRKAKCQYLELHHCHATSECRIM